MQDKEILKAALAGSGKKQIELARTLGVNQATVSTNLRRDKMGVDIFVKYLNIMGYTVMVGEDKNGQFEPKWEVTLEA